tara:strand:- start:1793 stop:2233 length:441 start_codon:yes stop_codon:yes gene_type:complete
MSSPFSKKFCGKNPLRNVEKPAKPVQKPEPKPMSDSEKKLMHATQSVTDKSIKEQEYPGKVGVIIGKGAPEMSPLDQGGYEGGGDIAGAYYVPKAAMYSEMFGKIGQAVADIGSHIAEKKKNKNKKKENKVTNQVEANFCPPGQNC